MDIVGAYEAKTHLPKLLERVMKGECVAISKHGVPVALLQPYDQRKRGDTREVVRQLREFRMRNKLGEDTIRDMIEEGRR